MDPTLVKVHKRRHLHMMNCPRSSTVSSRRSMTTRGKDEAEELIVIDLLVPRRDQHLLEIVARTHDLKDVFTAEIPITFVVTVPSSRRF